MGLLHYNPPLALVGSWASADDQQLLAQARDLRPGSR